jgi:thiamine pyrophosphate-dependent acetolactate synthase large subunit-like protein
MLISGNELVARALRQQGADMFFYIMGGPMMGVELATMAQGIRGIDVRHEQAGAMMAHAYARIRNRPGVCMAASGPATLNLVTGVAHAWADCVPLVALGGAAPTSLSGQGAFQEIDQLAIMRPATKWAERVHHTKRIPELIGRAFEEAMAGKPGPVYLDLPGDVLYAQVEEDEVVWPIAPEKKTKHRPAASAAAVSEIIALLESAKQPVIVTGGGILWSGAEAELQAFVEATGIPFYTTPQARGVIPEDHEYCYLTARSVAFREADVIIVLGTRPNYIIGNAKAPRFNGDAKLVRIDIDPTEINTSARLDVGVVADAKMALEQLIAALEGRVSPDNYQSWRERLAGRNAGKAGDHEKMLASTDVPIHPLKLCAEVREFMDRDAILVVDGQEILNYGRQAIPTHVARHRINSGVFGTMGVGLPCGVGAKAAKPTAQVIVLHGDGSFGFNAMELDTAVRHELPLLVVISLNGGWTGDPNQDKPGRDLGYTRYDKMAQALGCYAEYVEEPQEIRGALERAQAEVDKGRVAVVNVKTDWRATATTAAFTSYTT